MLLKLLEASRDSRTLAVGASDLGHFISAHPHGRAIVTSETPTQIFSGKHWRRSLPETPCVLPSPCQYAGC